MDWKKHSKWWVIGAAAAVILINAWAIYNEHLFIPFFSVAAIIAYLLLFRVDLAMYLMAFSTPFSRMRRVSARVSTPLSPGIPSRRRNASNSPSLLKLEGCSAHSWTT